MPISKIRFVPSANFQLSVTERAIDLDTGACELRQVIGARGGIHDVECFVPARETFGDEREQDGIGLGGAPEKRAHMT
jgi:hypothetical protein